MKLSSGAGDICYKVEQIPSMCEAMGSIPSTGCLLHIPTGSDPQPHLLIKRIFSVNCERITKSLRIFMDCKYPFLF